MSTVKLLRLVREWLVPLAIALAVALLLRTYVFAVARVEQNSMLDTLHEGERVAVTKIDLLFVPLARGEVVICRYPEDNRLFVKRIVALGGDTVELRGGVLYINGDAVEEPGITRPATADYPLCRVPSGHYFVLGDNRPHSMDSRQVGPLSAGLIEGRVRAVIWPLSAVGPVE